MGGIFVLLLAAALFVATCAVEAAVAGLLARPGRRRLLVETSLALNLLTWPLGAQSVSLRLASWWAAELGVLALEAAGWAIVAGLSWRRALGLALATNAASVLTGLAVFRLWLVWLEWLAG